MHQLIYVTLLLSGAFFFAELTVAPIWLVPMDVAPAFAGTASGIVNVGSALAGLISPVVFGFVVDATGHWSAPFYGSIALLVVGALAAHAIHPERSMDESAAL